MRLFLGFLLGLVLMAVAYENGTIRVNDTMPRLVADLRTTAHNLWQDINPGAAPQPDRQSSIARPAPDA